MLKVWITGANGQIGTAINQVVNPLEFEIINTDIEELDVTDIDAVTSYAHISRPDIIINCAAMTDVADCEADPKEAYRVNALGARNLAIAAWKRDIVMVQISTDDVFDGLASEPNKEFDATNPVTIYGKSKLGGEHYVKEFTQKHFIIRSNWVYGEGVNFVKDVLARAKDGNTIAAATDQFGSPTSAIELAKFILMIMTTNRYGTYHATNKGICSRYEFAKEVLRLAGKDNEVKEITSAESEFSSKRPHFAVLDNFILSCEQVYEFDDWKTALGQYIKEEN